jgi:hypothetical protein
MFQGTELRNLRVNEQLVFHGGYTGNYIASMKVYNMFCRNDQGLLTEQNNYVYSDH